MCRRRGLKVNAAKSKVGIISQRAAHKALYHGKSKVMVLNGEEGFECEVHVDGI